MPLADWLVLLALAAPVGALVLRDTARELYRQPYHWPQKGLRR